MELALKKLQGSYSILKLKGLPHLAKEVTTADFSALIISPHEITLICADRFTDKLAPLSSDISPAWSCLEVVSTHAFDEIGIIARISSTLAKEHISILSVSSFNGDHFMVPNEKINESVVALRKQGYVVEI
ncbi:ACT domain-containing protein [Pseudomonas aeruginosa]